MSKYTPEEIDAVIDEFKSVMDQFKQAQDDFDKCEFSKAYCDRLGKYSDKLKALNGDDFDIVGEAYKEHKEQYSDLSTDEYVDALEDNIKKVIERVWPSAPEEEKEAIAEHVAEDMNDHKEGETEVSIKTESEPEVEVVDTENGEADKEITSDEEKKRSTGPWASPSKSGGRKGKCGITSDEEKKEEPSVEKTVEEALPEPVKAVVEAATETPETTEAPEEEKDEYAEFVDELKRFKK